LNKEYGLNEGLGSDKKGGKILGIVLKVFAVLIIILVIAAVAVYIWQKDNIDAVINASMYTTEELKDRIEDSRKDVQNVLKQYNVTEIRDLTPEEELELCKGNMSADEAVAKIMGQDTSDASNVSNEEDSTSAQNGETSSQVSSESVSVDPTTEIVQKYIAQMYTLKASYMGQLGSLASSAKAQYDVDKKKYGKSTAVQNAIAANLSTAAALESQCDSEVETVLSNFNAELSAIGADTSIVDTVRTQYQNEKTLKKSYYLSMQN
jgi:uncharacterized membrane protein